MRQGAFSVPNQNKKLCKLYVNYKKLTQLYKNEIEAILFGMIPCFRKGERKRCLRC